MRLQGSFIAYLSVVLALPAGAAWAQPSLGVATHTLGTTNGAPPALDASDSRTQVPLYEFLELHTSDLGLTGLQIELAGAFGVHVGAPPLIDGLQPGPRVDGNVIVGLARWEDRARRISLTAGRQYLFLGAGRAEHLDGLSASYRTPWNVDVSLFGGRVRPWQVDYDSGDGDGLGSAYTFSDYAVGGRLRFRLLDAAVVSGAFVHEGHGDQIVRQSLAVQAGYYAFAWLEALAGGVLDLIDLYPQEVWASLTSRPSPALKLSADYSFQVPSLTLPKTSLFSVFSLASYHSATLGAHYGISARWLVGAEGGARLYPDGDRTTADAALGYSAAGSLRFNLGDARVRAALGLRSEVIDAGDQWSLQNRLYGSFDAASGLYGNVDVYLLLLGSALTDERGSLYERRLADRRLSVGALALLGYRFTSQLSLQVAGSGFISPLAAHDLRLLTRLSYVADWSFGR